MRAILAVLALAIALTGGAGPAPAAAAAPDNKGPACTDIRGTVGNSNYEVNSTSRAVFFFEFNLAAAPCGNATYHLYISTDRSGTTVIHTVSYPGDITLCDPLTNKLCYTHDFGAASTAPTPIYVTGASVIGGHTADTTPAKEFVLCDRDGAPTPYPDCPPGDNSWDR